MSPTSYQTAPPRRREASERSGERQSTAAWQGCGMAQREDFTDDQWYRLRSAPWQAAMGVVEVDPSGSLTTGHEIEAVEAALAASQFEESLVGLVTRDLLDADKPVDDEAAATSGQVAAEA